jgi:hypothetical protein
VRARFAAGFTVSVYLEVHVTGLKKRGRSVWGNKAALMAVLLLVALLVVLVVAVAGCGGGGLQGTWVSDKEGTAVITGDKISVVDADGTQFEFTYKVEGDTLLLSMEGLITDQPVPYKLDGDKLTLTMDGEDAVTFSRK